MATSLRILTAGLAAIFLFPSAPAAQTNSTTVDYLVVTPDYECVRISPGGTGPFSAQFTAIGWNRGPNAIAEGQGGDDLLLGSVPVVWALPDTVFDAHSGSAALTESPGGSYGNNWNVTAQINPSFNLTTAATASFEFWHHYELENGYDYAYVEANTGSGWSSVATYNGTLGSMGDFHFVSINLSSFLGDTVQFRLRVDTDGSVTRAGWVVDDVVVRVDGGQVFSDDIESGLANWSISSQWGVTVPGGVNTLGTINTAGLFKSGGLAGTTFVRAIYGGTLEATATVDIYPPDWVP